MVAYDDFDFESILETIEPIYFGEGAEATQAFLLENKMPVELVEELLKILDRMARGSQE